MESRDRVKKIAKCAEESNDLSMMKIIESDGFIERAVYHNGCVTNYLLKLKLEKTSKNNDESVHGIAFSSLVSSIHDDLFLHKKAFLISHLLDRYRSFLPNDVPDTYPSAKRHAKLLGHFGDRITIQPQRGQGMSNIMFSFCLTIGDAIAAAGKLKSMLRLTEIEHELATETFQESQEHILHSAASILRHDIQSFVINNEDYPNANEVSLAISVEKMPQSLLKFICWLIDEKAYKAASEPYIVPIDRIRKILGITESIVSLSKHTFTPFHLGLAVQLHHEFLCFLFRG